MQEHGILHCHSSHTFIPLVGGPDSALFACLVLFGGLFLQVLRMPFALFFRGLGFTLALLPSEFSAISGFPDSFRLFRGLESVDPDIPLRSGLPSRFSEFFPGKFLLDSPWCDPNSRIGASLPRCPLCGHICVPVQKKKYENMPDSLCFWMWKAVGLEALGG